jgi:hypothetical protein
MQTNQDRRKAYDRPTKDHSQSFLAEEANSRKFKSFAWKGVLDVQMRHHFFEEAPSELFCGFCEKELDAGRTPGDGVPITGDIT